MTFIEAAIEILKNEGKPLPAKELARLAIKQKLLLVVGRDPETTMQTCLQQEVRRPATDVVSVSPGVFGLRQFPSRQNPSTQKEPGPSAREQKMSAKEPPASKKKDRPSSAPPRAAEAEAPAKSRARTGKKRSEETSEVPPPAVESAEAEDQATPRRRRSGRAHQPGDEAQSSEAQTELPLTAKAETAKAEAAKAEVAKAETKRAEPVAAPVEAPKAEVSAPAPVEAPAAAEPKAVEKKAEVAAAPEAPKVEEPKAEAPPPSEPPPSKADAASAAAEAEAKEAQARIMPIAEAVYDVLRGSSEGRPVHYRQITDIAIKRRLARGEAVDLSRLARAAVVRDLRQRDSDGLRPRIKSLGNGMYLAADRKLEPELLKAETELSDRVNRTREATRVALRRRLKALPASAFELLMRLLLERIGMVNSELLKRGEGVAYYAGTLVRGSRSIKTLVAIRPGEGEVAREAIGELRAGMRLRGYDEGLVLAAGRLSAAAQAELTAGIDAYDQDPLTDLLIRHQVGVRRQQIPMDYLDTDLLAELVEPA